MSFHSNFVTRALLPRPKVIITLKINEMKKNFLFTIALLVLGFTFNSLNAQVQEKEALMSLGDQNALTIDIQNVDKKALESYYKGYFKEFGKV